MAIFHPGAVRFGKPGLLYIAPIGTAEPTSVNAEWPDGWVPLGYTAEGSAFNYATTSDDVEVAESLDPLATVMTGRSASVEVALAEITKRNLTIAFNGGLVEGDGAAWTFEPPALGLEQRVMLGWDAIPDYTTTDPVHTGTNDLRFLFRRVLQVGSLGLENRKGATKSTIAANFKLELPLDGKPVLKIWGGAGLNPDDTP